MVAIRRYRYRKLFKLSAKQMDNESQAEVEWMLAVDDAVKLKRQKDIDKTKPTGSK